MDKPLPQRKDLSLGWLPTVDRQTTLRQSAGGGGSVLVPVFVKFHPWNQHWVSLLHGLET